MRVMERKMVEIQKTLKSGIPNGNRFVISSASVISDVLTNEDANSDSVSISENVNVITTEDIDSDEEDLDKEVSNLDYMFIKGYTKSKNPGKLVINNRERFICAKNCGNRYYYVCACKNENKGKNVDKCRATANVITDDDENVIGVVLINREHNYILDETIYKLS